MRRGRLIRWLAACLVLAAVPNRAEKAPKQPLVDLSEYFEKVLRSVPVLSAEKIRRLGLSRTFPRADRDAVWDSLVKVVIQNGIIIHADKQAGVLMAMSNLVTRGPGSSQYDPMRDPTPLCNAIFVFVDRVDDTTSVVYMKADRPLNRAFFDLLSTHVYARESVTRLRRLPARRIEKKEVEK